METADSDKKRKSEDHDIAPTNTQKRRKQDFNPVQTAQSSKSIGLQPQAKSTAGTTTTLASDPQESATTTIPNTSKRHRRKRKAAARLSAESGTISRNSPPSQQLIGETRASIGSHEPSQSNGVTATSSHSVKAGNAGQAASRKVIDGKAVAVTIQQAQEHGTNLSKAQRKALKKARRQARSANVRASQQAVESDPKGSPSRRGLANGELTKRQRKQLRLAEVRKSQVANEGALQTAVSASQDLIQGRQEGIESPAKDLTEQPESNSEPSLRPSWTLSSPSGGRLIDHDPIFVTDSSGGQYLVSSNGREMLLLSLEDSLQVHSWVAPPGLSIVAFIGSVVDPAIVHIALSDSTTIRWSWAANNVADRQSLGTNWHANRSVVAMGAALTGMDDGNVTAEHVYHVDQKGDLFSIVTPPNVLFATDAKLTNLMVLDRASYIIAYGPKTLVVGKRNGVGADTDTDFDWVELPLQGRAVTCAAARISGSALKGSSQPSVSLALGNEEGQVHIFYDLNTIFNQRASSHQPKLPSPRILHWHRNAVSSLKFSKDGNYLISGGKETVLVLWQLETGKQQFLPHLASEIERLIVSPNGDRYALQMGDNSIIVLSTSELKAVAAFGGLQLAVESDAGETAYPQDIAAVLHPHRLNEFLLSVPGSKAKTASQTVARPFLETFDLQTSRHLSRQALARNNVTDLSIGPEETTIDPPDVHLLTMSSNGEWLATVDEWTPPARDVEFLAIDSQAVEEEQINRKESFLKIWRCETAKETGTWTLNFRADAPHARAGTQEGETKLGAGSVLAIATDPSSPGFATVGEDGALKLWKPKRRVKGKADFVEWRLTKHIQLQKSTDRVDLRMEEPLLADVERPSKACLAWSQDGSMLAATLVYPDSNEVQLVYFVNTLTGDVISKQGIVGPDVVALGFLSRHLILLSWRDIRLWDVVADSLHFHNKLPIPARDDLEPLLAVDPQEEGNFAVAIPENTKGKPCLRVWSPKRTKPLANIELDEPVAALLAGKGRSGYVCLYNDATIRTLYPLGTALSAPTIDSGDAIRGIPDASPLAEEMEVDRPLLLAAAPNTRADNIQDRVAFPGDAEDDRPVVRPEQLASVFEGAHGGAAMPSVKEMFYAVLGLVGKKPRRDIAEST